MRLAVDPGAFAWALTPLGQSARTWLAGNDSFAPAGALDALRAMRKELEAQTRLAPGELWDLLDALLVKVQGVPAHQFEEYLPLARRLVPASCAPTLALGLALEVDAILAGGPELGVQKLLPVIPAWPLARQRSL